MGMTLVTPVPLLKPFPLTEVVLVIAYPQAFMVKLIIDYHESRMLWEGKGNNSYKPVNPGGMVILSVEIIATFLPATPDQLAIRSLVHLRPFREKCLEDVAAGIESC